MSGEKVRIGVYDPSLPGSENKMRACRDELDGKAVSLIRKLMESTGEWVFVDEIGYLESASTPFMTALRELMARKRVIAAARKQDTPFLTEIRTGGDAFCVDLDLPFGNIGCVIMASGMSRRFGGNKLLAEFCGRPMIEYVLAVTEGIFTGRVVVTRYPEIAALCENRGIDVILHDLPFRSDTVRLGLEAVSESDGCIFCPADQPLLRKDTVASLAMSAANDQVSIWRTAFGEVCGSPVLFPKWTFEQLAHLPEGKGGGYIARSYPEKVRTVSARDEYELMDADDRAAFELLSDIKRTRG